MASLHIIVSLELARVIQKLECTNKSEDALSIAIGEGLQAVKLLDHSGLAEARAELRSLESKSLQLRNQMIELMKLQDREESPPAAGNRLAELEQQLSNLRLELTLSRGSVTSAAEVANWAFSNSTFMSPNISRIQEALCTPPHLDEVLDALLVKCQDWVEASVTEKVLQARFGNLLVEVKEVAEELGLVLPWFASDTSASGLAGSAQKPDFCLLNSPHKVWGQVVSLVELKRSAYHMRECVGQLVSRNIHLFREQPNRIFSISIGMCPVSVEIVLTCKQERFRSGPLSFSLERNSRGLLFLLKVLLSDLDGLGYAPGPIPTTLRYEGAIYEGFELVVDRGRGEEVSLMPSGLLGARIFRAACREDPSRQDCRNVIVKYGSQSVIEREAEILKRLSGLRNIVQLLHHGNASDGQAFLSMFPVGLPLLFDTEAEVLMLIFTQVLEVVHALSTLCAPLLHRDISVGNIMFTLDAYNAIQALLIDLATAEDLPPDGKVIITEGSAHVTGTPLFMAVNVLRRCHYNVSTDLESLFLVIVYLATGGKVHWRNARLDSSDMIDKRLVSFNPVTYPEYIDQRCRIEFKGVVKRLSALFYGPIYRTDVSVLEFRTALSTL